MSMTAIAPRRWRFKPPRIPDPLRPLFLGWLTRKSNLVRFAESELKLAGMFGEKSPYDGMLGKAVLQMVRQFSDEGHSGMSAGFTVSLFEKVARFQPLTPLTGEDDEWNEVGTGVFQNRRCSHVFKDETGTYDSQGRIFREPDGGCYQNRDSRVMITFPYTPTREYVDVPASEGGPR